MELHTMDLFFLCSVEETGTLTADDDVAELQWIAIEELRSEEFGLASIKKAIDKLKEIKNTLL
jgi:hypothetical protein